MHLQIPACLKCYLFATAALAQSRAEPTVMCSVAFGHTVGLFGIQGREASWAPRGGGATLYGTVPFDISKSISQLGSKAIILGRYSDRECGLATMEPAGLSLSASPAVRLPFAGAERVIYDPVRSHLYLLSHEKGSWVFRCAASVGGVPTAADFAVVASVPGQKYGGWRDAYADDGDGGLRNQGSVRLVEQSGRWTFERVSVPRRPAVSVRGDMIVGRELTLHLSVPARLLLEPKQGGARVDLGAGLAGTHSYGLPLGTTLRLGLDYRIVADFGTEEAHSDWSSPRLEFGTATVTGTVSKASPLRLNPARCYLGSGMLIVAGEIVLRDRAPAPRVIAWMQVTDEATAPPISVRGGTTWLQPGPGINLTSAPKERARHAGFEVKFSIPGMIELDPSLAGKLVYFQVCAETPNREGTYLSPVVGMKIRTDPPTNGHIGISPVTRGLWQRNGLSEAEVRLRLARAGF